MKIIKWCLLLGALINTTSIYADVIGSGSHGGDAMRILFYESKSQTAEIVRGVTAENLSSNTPTPVKEWLLNNLEELALDIENSQHYWLEENESQQTCATTDENPTATISLSYEECKGFTFNARQAGKILIHESGHHFELEEWFADALAVAVFSTSPEIVSGSDLGFRLNGYNCFKGDTRGKNPYFFGECGHILNIDLSEGNFSGYLLAGAKFQDVTLDGASFRNAYLERAYFSSSSSEGIVFDNAYLKDAYFFGSANYAYSSFKNAVLVSANFSSTDLWEANFEGAKLDRLDMSSLAAVNANFKDVSLDNSYIYSTNLTRSNFNGATATLIEIKNSLLLETNFENAKLLVCRCLESKFIDTVFLSTDLSNGVFTESIFDGAIFEGAKLFGANFSEADLEKANMNGAFYNDRTKLPFSSEEAKRRGMIFVSP